MDPYGIDETGCEEKLGYWVRARRGVHCVDCVALFWGKSTDQAEVTIIDSQGEGAGRRSQRQLVNKQSSLYTHRIQCNFSQYCRVHLVFHLLPRKEKSSLCQATNCPSIMSNMWNYSFIFYSNEIGRREQTHNITTATAMLCRSNERAFVGSAAAVLVVVLELGVPGLGVLVGGRISCGRSWWLGGFNSALSLAQYPACMPLTSGDAASLTFPQRRHVDLLSILHKSNSHEYWRSCSKINSLDDCNSSLLTDAIPPTRSDNTHDPPVILLFRPPPRLSRLFRMRPHLISLGNQAPPFCSEFMI